VPRRWKVNGSRIALKTVQVTKTNEVGIVLNNADFASSIGAEIQGVEMSGFKCSTWLSSLCLLFAASAFGVQPSEVGAVAAGHPLAVNAGMNVLKRGGNAFDAAVAIAATLNVVEPMMSGVGGYGSIVIYNANTRQVRYLNGAGKFPKATDTNFMRPPIENYLGNRLGAKSVSVPGNVNSWYELHALGKLRWNGLFDDAIRHAEQGYEISTYAAGLIAGAFDQFPDYAKTIYGNHGKPLTSGEVLRQADLGRTLKSIAQYGPDAFYQGEIAAKIDRQMRVAGGFLSLEDLQGDKAQWWDPSVISFKGHDVYTMGTPGNGFTSLFALGVMEHVDPGRADYGSATSYHLLAEVLKKSVAVRLTTPGTPEAASRIHNEVLTAANFRKVAASVDPERSSPFLLNPGAEHENTTHFVVADRWGNVVSATQTLGNGFGSKILVEDTGIWLNNSMAFSTFEPKGNPMDPVAGQYKLSSNSPMIILKDGRPWAALGTPGGHTIPQNAAQIALNLIDRNMPMQAAIDAPKIAYLEDKDVLRIESGIADVVVSELQRKGHRLVTGPIGNAMGIRFESGPGQAIYDVGIDTRRDWHTAISYF
jgi:gamma-glutamyltranspeptidase/glutathione hydrolase